MRRVGVICLGRGTYTKGELGSLTDAARPDPCRIRRQLVERADRERVRSGRRPLAELDRMDRFSELHLRGENAAALIFVGSVIDARSLADDLDVVAVCGNSMGWYTALHVAGALGFDDGFRLVETLGGYQADGIVGGQVIVPVVDASWRPDPAARLAVAAALADARARGLRAWTSIHLGGYEVLAGEDDAMRFLLKALPASKMGERDYPFQLKNHSAFHTPLLAETSSRALEELQDLRWSAPAVTLIDGRGHRFSPRTARGEDLYRYTLGPQVTETFDFTTSVRVLLREFAPDALVLLGPGDSLGGAIGQVLIQEGWAGLHSREDFLARQKGSEPILYAMARPDQYDAVAAR